MSSEHEASANGPRGPLAEDATARAPAAAERDGGPRPTEPGPPDARSAGAIDRRSFLMTLGAAAAAATIGTGRAAAETPGSEEDPYAMLVDTTRCVGCRTCEASCAEANGLPPPDMMDDAVFQKVRNPSETQFTVVNRFQTSKGEVFVKRQCMHCRKPACAAACLTRAMLKTTSGPVVWRENKCMGCRFCMVSCPFDRLAFEYHSAVPRIRKCTMCAARLKDGGKPACAENCPAEAIVFGRRSALLEEARRRILAEPDNYVHQIYGEQEVGGTSWLYLASVPFDQLGFRTDLGETPYPKLTEGFLYAVPVIFATVPALLLAINRATRPAAEPVVPETRHEHPETESLARA